MTKFYKSMMAAALVALSALSASAYDFEEGGLYYNINGDAATLTTGDVAYTGNIVIPATVEHDGTTYNVTAIGTVFQNNTTVTSLKLPTSVTSLPASCFAGMTGLLELEIPNVENLPNYLVDGCTALTTLTLGEGVHMASCHMTRGCNSLTRVTMLYTDVVGWNSPSGGIGGSTIPAQYKPISNAIQGQATLYIPYGTTDAYKTKKNTGWGSVTLWNKFSAYVELDPPGGNVDVTGITIAPENPVLAAEEGATVQLTATVLPEDATDKSIVWSTSDANIATVSNTGLVTRTAPLINDGDQPYTVTITATAANDVVATVTVTAQVLANIPVASITIAPENPILAAEDGATVQLTATPLPENALDKSITWSSADETIATVDANGLVTRVAPLYNNDVPFTVDITATAANGVTQTVTVTAQVLETVLPTAISIEPEAPVLTAETGSTVQLSVNFTPENTTETGVTWSSADENIATVDDNGLVTRTAPLTSEDEQPYTVVITATTPNGLTANVTVTANVKGEDFFVEDGIYYNVLSADDLTVEVTNSVGGTASDPECYSGDIVIPTTVTHKGRTYTVTGLGAYAFGSGSEGSPAVTSITIPEGITAIDPYALRGMSGISELTIPSTVTEIEPFTLTRLSAETITILGARVLGMSALANCPNLKHLILGESVRELDNNITNNVTTMETVTCYATTPPTWDGTVATFAPFKNFISTATLYVPEGCRDAYYNKASSGIYYWRFGTIEEMVEPVEPVNPMTLAEALNYTQGDELTITDELIIALVEVDGTAILTDNAGNWIATNFSNEVKEAIGVGANSVKAGTLQGTISNLDTNPVFTITNMPEAGESTAEPVVESIDLHTAGLLDIPGNSLVNISGFYGSDGMLRAYSNPNDPGQKFTIDNTYIGEGAFDSYIDKNISFTAIVRLKEAWEAEEDTPAGAPRRVKKTDMNSASNYIIVPTSTTTQTDITTAVSELKVNNNNGVMYVNPMGQVSSSPFKGINIVVDGDKVTKVIK